MYQLAPGGNDKETTNKVALKSLEETSEVHLLESTEHIGENTGEGSDLAVAPDCKDHVAMSSEHSLDEPSQDAVQQHGPPQPPPFNPMPSHTNQQTSLGTSVVPDLMKVYESMSQSSTPQDHVADGQYQLAGGYDPYGGYPPAPAPSGQPSYYPHDPQQQSYYPAPHGSGSYQGTGPPVIPPVPDYPPKIEGHPTAPVAAQAGVPDPPPPSSSNPAGRSLRKRTIDKTDTASDMSCGSASKTRKKGNTTDGRWSKRFTWPDDLHRDFVSAIFDVGLKHASPSAVLEHMARHEAITSERIKSHLQKYRLHRTKSKKEFMTSYGASLNTGTGATEGQQEENPEPKPEPPKPKDDSNKLMLPQLSEDEKKSPIGTSLGYLMGLFFSLRQQLMAQRAAQAAAMMSGAKPPVEVSVGPGGLAPNQPVDSQVGAVYSHFVTDMPDHYHDMSNSWQAPAPHDGAAGAIAPVFHDPNDPKAHPPSTRTNFEENKLMKREMQSQMAFQNKMRGLKQRELNKYKSAPDQPEDESKANLTPNPLSGKQDESKDIDDSAMSRSQGTGEIETIDSAIKGRPRGLSEYVTEEFWNADIVDEQLFEFLMNP